MIGAAQRRVAAVTAWSLLLAPPAAIPAASQTAPAKPAATAATATTPARPAEPDGGWPRVYNTPGGAVFVLYQPQVASWTDQKRAVLYVAVSYLAKGAEKPALGTLKLEADTSVALPERLVSFSEFTITESTFQTLDRDQVRAVVADVTANVPRPERVIALDRVLASIDKSQIVPKNVNGLKADPPVIFYSTTSAVLVNLDGEPIWSPIKENDLKFAVNTNWDLFQYPPTNVFYLRNNHSWLQASSVTGPWKAAGALPGSFAKLPADDNWKDVKAALNAAKLPASQVPKVFVSTKPAELILVTGAPNYLVVPRTKLLWLSNSESDVFRQGKTGPIFFLVSGRWFSSADFAGPWTFATPTLPDDFKNIPLEHARSRVLASVPGTPQAAEAVLLAGVPQTARVSKKQVKAPEVTYQGEPQFQPIESTTVARAANTDKDIIKVGDIYYMCFQGVWFMAKAPGGPWEVTGSVPKEIYEIPPSSPSYNVTHVTVIEDDDDDVMFATAAAFTGVMIGWGCAVWGTGYYYPPYIGYGGFYPAYYPFYPTYGYHASYNPWTGAYSRGAVAYGPYGGAGVGARYNPRTGTYARGAAAYGPYGARGVAGAYNPRTGTSAGTRQGSNVYGSWGQTGVTRGDQWATTSRVTNNRGTTTRRTETSGGGTAVTRRGATGTGGAVKTGSGDVYAGRDGNVYRNNGGSWQKYDNGGWNSVAQPTPQQRDQAQQRASDGQQRSTARDSGGSSTVGQLNRDSAARSEGAQRTRDASAATSSRSSGASSSYRPSSGASRGGGARAGGGRRR